MEGLRRNSTRAPTRLRAVGESAPFAALVAVQVNWPLAVLALVATFVTLVLLVPMPPQAEGAGCPPPAPDHRERRRAPVTGRREAREALALVGEALAALVNPRAGCRSSSM